jgi:TP901 family phage tail tape measure protein
MANKVANRTVKIWLDGTEIDNSVNSIQSKVRKLTAELKKTTIGTEEYENKMKQIGELQGILNKHKSDLKDLGKTIDDNNKKADNQKNIFSRAADGVNKYSTLIASSIAAVTGFSLTIRKAVQSFADMEESMANTRKYTGQTDGAVRQMNEDFKKMDTRTSREQLNELAGAAGRLGITSTKDIEDFVDGADKISVALGDDLGEGAVDKIGKLAQMFGEDKTKGLRGAMLATGSAVNELAQNSSANAGYIVDFTADLAGVGQQAGLTQAQIMGYASALDQNMQEEATSSTVFSQLITKMFQEPQRFAQLSGQKVTDFTKLLKTDANKALIEFLGAMKSRGGFDSLAPMFKEMKLDGTRAVGVLSAVATHLDQVKTAQDLANKSYNDGTSVINEFNIQNNTVQAQLDKAGKQFKELTINLGQKLMPVAKYGITTGSAIIKILSKLINFVVNYRTTIIVFTAALIMLNAKKLLHIAYTKLQIIWSENLRGTLLKLWTTLKANPWQAIAAVVAIAAAAIYDYVKKANELTQSQKSMKNIQDKANESIAEQKTQVDMLTNRIHNNNLSLSDRMTAIQALQKIIPDYTAKISKEGKVYQENTIALSKFNAQLQRKALIEGAKDELNELGKKRAELVRKAAEQNRAVHSAIATNDNQQNIAVTSNLGPAMSSFYAGANVKQKKADLSSTKREIKEVDNAIKDVTNSYGKMMADEIAASSTDYGNNNGNNDNTTSNVSSNNKDNINADKKVQKELDRIDAEYEKKKSKVKEQYMAGEIKSQEDYNRKIEDIELDQLDAKLKVAGLEPKKREEINKQIVDAKLKLYDKIKNMMSEMGSTDDEILDDELNTLKQKYNEQLSLLDDAHNKQLLSDEEYERDKKKINERYEKDRNDDVAKDASKKLDLAEKSYKAQLLILRRNRREEYMTDEQYNNAIRQLRLDFLTKVLSDLKLSNEDRAALQDEYNNLIEDQQDDAYQKIKDKNQELFDSMRDDMEQIFTDMGTNIGNLLKGEKDSIKTLLKDILKDMLNLLIDYLEKQLLINDAEILAKNVAKYGGIIGAIKSAAEVALIHAPFKLAKAMVSSFYDGGFTPSGAWNQEQGVVHSNEFVANRFATKNPSLLPVLNLIDTAQKRGSVSNLSNDDVAAVIGYGGSVRQIKGATSTLSNNNTDNALLIGVLNQVILTMKSVKDRFDKPIVAETYATGKGGTIEAEELVKRMKSNVSRS